MLRSITTLFAFAMITIGLSSCVKQASVAELSVPLSDEAVLFQEEEIKWYDAQNFLVEGKGWDDTEAPWERLPLKFKDNASEANWNLSKCPAGISVRFLTDSNTLKATWDGGGGLTNMTPIGMSGLDVYRRVADDWIFIGVGRPKTEKTTATISSSLGTELNEYLIFLPSYKSTSELLIGLDADAQLLIPEKPEEKPVVFYGTSITQGGCSSRSGMGHVMILRRWMERETIDLGFSGSGKMEFAMAEVIGDLDASAYVLECLPNMTDQVVEENFKPFVHELRRLRPQTPILLVEHSAFDSQWARNQRHRELYKELKKEGVKGLHYLSSDGWHEGFIENGTVDYIHPTDLGFIRMAEVYQPAIEKILKD